MISATAHTPFSHSCNVLTATHLALPTQPTQAQCPLLNAHEPGGIITHALNVIPGCIMHVNAF